MDLPADLADELAAFTDRLASATDLGVAIRDKYRRSTAAFLAWLAQAREANAVDAFFALRGSGRLAVVREHRRVRPGGRGELAAEPVDVVLVAELMGHTDLNTTRRYALPSGADKARALEALTTDR